MSALALMIQGTGSDVGKSVVVAGLCRLARRRGIDVAPFKPQNMSNNAAVTADGGEIGRAQALQAQAAGIETSVHLNPVLLKPESDRRSQIVVQGRALASRDAAAYMRRRDTLLAPVLDSFGHLAREHELIIVEGAGSPAEVNLRQRDIANMGFARAAGVPVCLLGDIDRGGVIAALVGTRVVLDAADRAMIHGFMINKFRGDSQLFDEGVTAIERATDWPCFGVVPWLAAAAQLPSEDAVALFDHGQGDVDECARRPLRIAAPMLSRISNTDDADPLRQDPAVDFQFVPPGRPIPRDVDVILLFGTKSTRGDLAFLEMQGWHHDIHAHVRTGGSVLGLCGGYQLLGRRISDPDGNDGPAGEDSGLGLLDIQTRMQDSKTLERVHGRCALSGASFEGYEIHSGQTTGIDCERPMIHITQPASARDDGARSGSGRVEGCYVHGIFADDDFRAAWLARHGKERRASNGYRTTVEQAIDGIADGLAEALDLDALFDIATPVSI